MLCTIRPGQREKISMEINGTLAAENIRYPEALAELAAAYTNEIRELLTQLRSYRAAAEAALVQAQNALDRIKELSEEAERRHLGG